MPLIGFPSDPHPTFPPLQSTGANSTLVLPPPSLPFSLHTHLHYAQASCHWSLSLSPSTPSPSFWTGSCLGPEPSPCPAAWWQWQRSPPWPALRCVEQGRPRSARLTIGSPAWCPPHGGGTDLVGCHWFIRPHQSCRLPRAEISGLCLTVWFVPHPGCLQVASSCESANWRLLWIWVGLSALMAARAGTILAALWQAEGPFSWMASQTAPEEGNGLIPAASS